MKQEELVRERDFYRAKLKEEKSLVRTLRFECAELQKRDAEVTKRLSEMANRPVMRPRNKRPH
jgi:hypothetical protein|tara:strand:+ start:1177 stop:1365 length:189 start_codon:yes stop_codon:yes gene_type:complete